MVRGAGDGVVIQQLIQLPHAPDWYLPLALYLPRQGRASDVMLALVPIKRLTAVSGSLSFVKDSWITVVTTSGVRLFSYSKTLDELQVNGPPIPHSIPELCSSAVALQVISGLADRLMACATKSASRARIP